MSKTLTNKVRLILVLALVMVVSVCAGMFAFAKADPVISSVDEVTSFTMESTGIFYNEADDKVGLEFKASISAEEFEAIQTLNGFNYGLVIAPANYKDLTQDHLFGDSAIYDWAEYDEVAGEYVYNGDKIRVININADKWVLDGDKYTYAGAIVDILPQNIGEEFMAVAYVSADGLYELTNVKYTSTAIEVSKLGDEVPAYVPSNWEPYETEYVDLGIVAPDFMGGSVIDLSGAIGATVELVDNFGNKITEGLVDFNLPENQRAWTMNIYFEGILIEVWTLDVVAENGLFVWNNEVSMNSVDAIDFRGDDKVRTDFYTVKDGLGNYRGNAQEENIDGKDYITFTASGDNGTWFAWKPVHSKEYYEAWTGKGIELSATLKVDVSGMVNPDDKDGVLNQQSIFGVSGDVQIKQDMTRTEKTSLEDILANWDSRVGCNWDGQWGTRLPVAMIYVYNVHNGGKIAVSFDVNVPAEAYANKGGDILVNVEEVEDLTALDLTKYMEEQHAKTLEVLAEEYDLTYSLKGYSIADVIEVTDLTAVDVSNAKLAAYDLVVKAGENIYYTARIDLYNTTDAVVWAESLTKENVVLRRTADFFIGAYYTENTQATFIDAEDYEIVDVITVGDKTYEGSFVKYTATEDMNLSVDIKALHSKAYYNAMIGDTTKIMHLRGYISADTTMQVICAANNYGMNNTYTLGRQGIKTGKLESFVFSLDNMLIANSGDETYHGKFYDWNNIYGTNVGLCRPMITFEVDKPLVAGGSWDMYFGIYGEHIMDAGESLAKDLTTNTIDLTKVSSFDLINLLPENQHAKFKAMAALWAGKDGKNFKGNAIGFVITVGGQKINVVADAEGKAILDLDAFVVAADGTVSDTVTVRSLLAEGNNAATIRGFAAPADGSTSGWPVYLFPVDKPITIVAPAAPVVE